MCKNELNIYYCSNIKVQRVNCEVVVSDNGEHFENLNNEIK